MDQGTDTLFHDRWSQGLRWLANIGWLAVWIYVGVVMLSVLGQPIGPLDECIPLISARMVHQGLKPAVDFWTFYPPMLYYVLSAGFSVFGQTVFLTRFFAGGVYLVFLCVTARFFRGEFPAFRPLIPWIVLLQAVSLGPNLILTCWPSLALSCISVMIYLSVRRSSAVRRDWLMALAGFVAGLSLLLRVNFGLYGVAVVAFDLVFMRMLSGKADSEPYYATPLRSLLSFAGGLVLSNALFYGPVYGTDSKIVFAQSVVAVSGLIRKFGFLKFGRLGFIAIALPTGGLALKMFADEGFSSGFFISAATSLAIVGVAVALRLNSVVVMGIPALEIGLIVLLHKFVRRIGHPEMCLLVFYACLMHYYLSRADILHLAPLWVVAAMLAPFLILSSSVTGPKQVSAEGKALAALFAATIILFLLPGHQPGADLIRLGAARLTAVVHSPGISDGKRFFSSEPSGPWAGISDPDEAAAMRFVLSVSPPTEPVFVSIAHHSLGFVNDLRFYWLSDKPIVLRHASLDAATLDAPGQAGIIADLKARRIRYAVLEDTQFYGTETGYVGSTMLDEYLASHYQAMASFGRFGIFRRKEE